MVCALLHRRSQAGALHFEYVKWGSTFASFSRQSQVAIIKSRKETNMNWDRIEGNWKQFKGNIKERWGKLTDDQLDVIAGKREQLSGKIQEVYGITKDETEKQISDWQARLKDLTK